MESNPCKIGLIESCQSSINKIFVIQFEFNDSECHRCMALFVVDTRGNEYEKGFLNQEKSRSTNKFTMKVMRTSLVKKS